ncbi:hypothetical protein BRC19_02865 [Candidatus Saccharibacteria bacterium QS_5_54_17]|nr:MAG: hypothetical protein BRC19_02865 [Candidatus Saccharibacteria bacterium QS_5_54_17]
MLNRLRQTRKGRWLLLAAILMVYIASLAVWSPEVYRFDYDDYAVQEADTFQSLLSRGGQEPREITNFITQRLVEKREITRGASSDASVSDSGNRLLANSSPSARDGDHITTEGNTLIISHPGGEYETHQISSQEDIQMRRIQIGFYVVIVTLAMLLCLSWVWQKPPTYGGKISSLTALLNRDSPELRRLAIMFFRVLLITGIVLATLAAMTFMLGQVFTAGNLFSLYSYPLGALVLVPLAVTAVLWVITQLVHFLVYGSRVKVSGAWAILCFAGFYVVIFIDALAWFI